MIDAIVPLALERIADLLSEEAAFLSGVKVEVIRLQDELKRMQCFLKDADSRQDHDDRVRNWISEIRGAVYDSEDVIDTFILKIASARGDGARRLINKFTCLFTDIPDLYKIGNQIDSIRTKVAEISSSMQTYGIEFDAGKEASKYSREMQQRLRRSYPHDEEEHVISFDAITRDLKAQLMLEEERFRVVSIVGMGGLGKTTIAKKVYNDIHVKQHFDCHSWAFISQQFSLRDVLIGILMEVASTQDKSKLEKMEEEMASKLKMKKMKEELVYRSLLEKMKEGELVKTLYDVLREKRYMVVLDDIWKNEAWDSLKHAFPNGKSGSKVLFTTRNKDVASYADPWSIPLEPPLLSIEEGWKLLSKKAFPNDIVFGRGWEPEYETMGKEMVKKCGGLPLAVVVIGGLLATKASVKEWKLVQRNLNTEFAKLQRNHQYGGVYGVIALSYHDLPFHLKPCFLYLSQFPEDWQINKKTLTQMWIAEGFISQSTQGEGETMEDIAEHYLEELVSRCMVQVSQIDHTGSGIKSCRVHDLVRDLCISKAKEENFLGVIEHREYTAEAGASFSTVTCQSRRVAIHSRASRHDRSKGLFSVPLLETGDSRLRSLFYFVEKNTYRMKSQQAISIFRNFRLLRVLNIENVIQHNGYVSAEIGNLIHLRYLGLRGVVLWKVDYLYYQLTILPSSISNLRNLYTLDLRNNYYIKLPDVVWKLECLRHLLVESSVEGFGRLDSLRNLETLKHVKAKNLIRKIAVFQLTNLRKLAVEFKSAEEVEVIFLSPSVANGRLRSLKMRISSKSSFPSLEALSACQDLTKAVLIGKVSEDIGSVSHNLEYLPGNLTKLILCGSELKHDPMVSLKKLHNLRFLSLEDDAYKGSEIVCSANGFRRLEILRLECLEVREWRIEEGAMSCLKTLYVRNLKSLRMIPQGLKFVTTLQELKLIEMAPEFEKRVKLINGVQGEDFDKVQHIPSISFD